MKRYHTPPTRQRSPGAQTRQVFVAAHAVSASSSSSGKSVKDTTTAQSQLRELCIDTIPTLPQTENGNRDLVTQRNRQRTKDIGAKKKSIDEISRHNVNEIPHPTRSRSRFAEVKDEWPAPRRNVKDATTTHSRDLCIDIMQTIPKRANNGNRDVVAQYHRQRSQEFGARQKQKSINEIPHPPRSRSRFAEIKDDWSEFKRLQSGIEIELGPCDDLVSCVTLPSTIQHNKE